MRRKEKPYLHHIYMENSTRYKIVISLTITACRIVNLLRLDLKSDRTALDESEGKRDRKI